MYLIPKPQYCGKKEGYYTIAFDRKIVIDKDCGQEAYGYAKMLQEELAACGGCCPAITKGKSRKAGITLSLDGKMRPEEYILEVNKKGIYIAGGACQGILYGVQTLRQIIRQEGTGIPCLMIRDYPAIANRALYYDVTRGRIPTLSYLKKLADRMAFYKLNQLQLYIEHTFLFEGMSEVWRDDTPLTAQDILELDEYCRGLQIELVPSIAGFGHLYKVLRTKTYGQLCELPDADEHPFGFVDRMEHHTLDASNPESIRFVEGLIDEYLPLFTSRQFNIGADETFDLGKGRSRELADEKGTDRMYLDFVKELCEFVVSRGRRPMFWGDIICSFPEAVRELPPQTICLNWGYERDQSEEDTRSLAKAGAVQYLCPGVRGWDQLVNEIRASYENIRRMCTYAAKYHAIGVLTTDWGDCGHINHPDFGIVGMIYGAAFSWNTEIPEFDEINRQISLVEFSDRSEAFVSVISDISENWVFKWRDAVNYMEKRAEAFAPEKLLGIDAALEALEKTAQRLYRIMPEMDREKRKLMQPYFVAIRGMELIQKIGVVLTARDYHVKPVVPVNGRALAAELEEWFYYYKEIWRSVSRESELYRIQNVIFWYADLLRDSIF